MALFEVLCPCCDAVLRVDPVTKAVITHRVPEKPKPIEDLAAEVEKLKAAPSRREQVFQKSFEDNKKSADVLSKKFDELFKQAKENPDEKPPLRDFDL